MATWLGILIGVVILTLTWISVVFTLVIPRALSGPGRLTIGINRLTRRVFFAVSRGARTYERKDAILAPIGPVAVLAQLVVWLVLRRVTLLIAAGIAIGAGLAVWAAQFVASLLFRLEPRDPITLLGAALTLSIVGAVAGWLPARRAARVDPAAVLRES